jgi:hypothetical protein
MELQWYLKVADKEVGPLSARQLKTMADRGQITPGDPIRKGSEGRWVPAGTVKGLLPAAPSPSSASPGGQASETKEPDAPSAPAQPQSVPQQQARAVPVAQPVAPAPASGGVHIDAGDDTLVSRYAGRRGGKPAHPKKRGRRDHVIVIALAVALVVLIAAGVGLMLWRSGPDESAAKPQAEAGEANVDEDAANASQTMQVDIPGLAEYLGEPSPEGTEAAEPEPTASEKWTDASTSSAECGDVTVKIAAAEIGRPRLIGRSSQRAARPKTDYLTLTLELSNRHQTKKLEYTSWNVQRNGVSLVDEHANQYRMKSFANQGLEIDGQMEGGKGSLYPQESTQDMLVFEKPAQSAERLRLELPAGAFGGSGSLRFEIPASMIAVAEDPQEGEVSQRAVGVKQGEVAPGREVPAISRAIAEIDSEGAPAQDAEDPNVTAEVPDEGIPIPGVTGEEGEEEEEGPSMADDPEFQEAYEKLRRQQQEAGADEDRPKRKRRKR